MSSPEATNNSAPEEGSIIPATVVKVNAKDVSMSFGWKCEGLVPLSEFADADGKAAVKVGDKVEVLVESLGEQPTDVVLSKEKAEKLRSYEVLVERCKKGGPVEGTVVEQVNGGYSVLIPLPAFLPNSQSGVRREEAESIVGKAFTFDVTEYDEGKQRIVLSRKARAKQEQEAKVAELKTKLVEGAVLPGVVKSMADYGAFIDLGGIDGLLHVSQLSWSRVNNPKEVLRLGQELQVKVLKHDAATGKVSLGLKQLLEDPWEQVEKKFSVGREVEGKVTNCTDFGAFVLLEPGIEGLIPIAQMSWTKKVGHPTEVVKPGETVRAVVLEVNKESHRLSLGMKQLMENPWKAVADKYPVGSIVHGKVRGITEFGLFVEIEEGVQGLVHVSELSWAGKVEHPNELFKEGDEVDAKVIEVSLKNQKISLSIKQVQPSPWDTFQKEHPVGSKLKGRVTRVVDFGCFVECGPGIEGLIHVSELREERVERPQSVVKIGQEIEAQVIKIEAGRGKVSLSVKAMSAIEEADYREFMNQPVVKTTLGDLLKDKLNPKK